MLAMGFPLIYRQGNGLFDTLGELAGLFGKRPLVVADQFVRDMLHERTVQALAVAGLEPVFASFDGECSPEAIDQAAAEARAAQCDVIIGLGGGKVLDAAKGVKLQCGIPIVIVPTIASNDSPASRLIITYSKTGEFIGPRFMVTNPDAILVDTGIIAQAPVRFFVAGIGDALVTKFEADQCRDSGADNFFGGRPTQAALCLADHCYNLVRQHGEKAVTDVRAKQVTPELDIVVEACVLLSGLGFEGCGVAAAHAVGMAIPRIPEIKGVLHGEEVAVGLLTQLVLEGHDDAFINDMLAFYEAIGLPSTLQQLGLADVTDAHLKAIADFAARPQSRIHNMAMPINAGMLKDALNRANSMAKEFRSR
ncbi:MAG: glycerol dehydrogenase [Rhodospirillales bacterium]|nr:glycerol dehydrogenase [Rhodospirillales bacterium]